MHASHSCMQCGASLRILTLRMGARNKHRVLSLVLKSRSKVFQKKRERNNPNPQVTLPSTPLPPLCHPWSRFFPLPLCRSMPLCRVLWFVLNKLLSQNAVYTATHTPHGVILIHICIV